MTRSRDHRVAIVLVILIAAVARYWGLGFGLPYANSRPDEVALAGPAAICLEGDWRPPDFFYPSLYIYTLAFIYIAYVWITRPLGWYKSLADFAASRRESLAPFFYLNRGLSALFGTLTVWWLYSLGRRVFDETVGLVAGLFLALSFLHVRDSHFGTTDITMTALVVLAVLSIERWRDDGTVRSATLAGAVAGLAGSVKYNGLGVCLAFAVAAVLRLVDRRTQWRTELRRVTVSGAAFAAALILAFLVTTPYIVIEWGRFIRDIGARSTALAAPHGIELPRGWIYHATVSLPSALGWPLYVAGVTGAALLSVLRFRQTAVVLAFPVAYYFVSGSLYTVFVRYSLPLVPFLALTAAWLVVGTVRLLLPAGRQRLRAAAIGGLSLALVAPSALSVARFDTVLTRDDNRLVAARALSSVVAQESTLYQSGGDYGRIPLDLGDPALHIRRMHFDEATNTFSPRGNGFPEMPEWIVIQRSGLIIYSRVPRPVEEIVRRHYRLIARFDAHDERPNRIYDQQDAFFYPLQGLAGVERLGPNIEAYQRAR